MNPDPALAIRASVLVRPSLETDVPAVTAIYGSHVESGTGTFELEAPDASEIQRRRNDVLRAGWPWLVAEVDGRVAGFAYASAFRARRAYRFCVEDSIYVDARHPGRGIGRILLAELIGRCQALGARQMIAVIGDSANAASIRLHEALGFERTGLLQAAGWKLERWLDVVLMQRPLGEGMSCPPAQAR
jgi:L-amino acid N-acyltransferase YncA